MIEDVLATLEAEGFVVTNTFQVSPEYGPQKGAFGVPGWQVFLRNVRNTRTGIGLAPTLQGALEVAYAAAMRGETYERPPTAAGGIPVANVRKHYKPLYAPAPRAPVLSSAELDDASAEDLF